MERKRSTFTSLNSAPEKESPKSKETTRKARGDCDVSESTSHTQFFRMTRHEVVYERITTDEYYGRSESISGSSDSFRCVHGPEGKQYTAKGLLKRNILKGLDKNPTDRKWTDSCAPAYDWEMAKKLEFLVQDPTVDQQKDRLESHLRDFSRTANMGYKVDVLDSVCTIMDYLVEALSKKPSLQEGLLLMLQNMSKPILLNAASDVITYFDKIRNYFGFLGYLLIRMEDDDHFDMVSKALIWHLSAPDTLRGQGAAHLRCTLAAAAPVMYHTTARMLAVATSHRFPTYMEIALLICCDSVDNCMELMKENIIENIFYRFNPYFPEKKLPCYDINPADLQDYNVKLGDSSVNMPKTLSLLLVLLKTTKQFLEGNPKYRLLLPCPDCYAQRCFIWAYRYDCRAREHNHERITLTVIATVLLHCFGDRLMTLSTLLMPDVMSLSVLTELPPRQDWIRTVNINTSQADVHFKKVLIHLSVDFLKAFPYNKFMVESRYWLLGLMYLLDPGLCYLRARWSPSLFAELRKTALQALVSVLPLTSTNLVQEYSLIRRLRLKDLLSITLTCQVSGTFQHSTQLQTLTRYFGKLFSRFFIRTMWYIEWYSESPFELPVLYWCVRLLQVATYHRCDLIRQNSLRNLFDTHGVIIIAHLCYKLLEQKVPPVEKSQAIIALCLRLLTSAVEANARIVCCVYPTIKWPASINSIARKMMDIVLFSLEKGFIISDKWLISLLNFIWEAIIWKKDYREKFIANNGVYKLLDLITLTRAPVQCIALALVCDVARAGDAVGQLVSWRANMNASNAYPVVAKRGSTIASLLASIFRDECRTSGVHLNEYSIIQELDCPLMTSEVRNEMNKPDFREGKSQRTVNCLAAADLAGSRMSKAFALIHMLSEDLEYKVSLADEAYNLYKHIQLAPEDEAILILCSHYMTLKLTEVWTETKIQSPGLLQEDNEILEEFLHIGRGWAKEIKQQQEDVIEKDRKKEHGEEYSLYAFLGRVRLNIALDALREVRCVARSADRARITHALIQDAVRAHHRRSVFAKNLGAPVLRTYAPSLDDQNITGQNVKVYSIHPKGRPKPVKDLSST